MTIYKVTASEANLRLLARRYKELTKEECPPVSGFRARPPLTKLEYKSAYIRTLGSEAERVRSDGRERVMAGGKGIFKNREPVSRPLQGFTSSVTPYLPKKEKLHSSHAISAVQYKDTLICFNAWGRLALPKDKNVWKFLAKQYKCKKTIVYKGPNLQSDDSYGLCVGYAYNFVLEMMLTARKGKLDEIIKSQAALDKYVHKALLTRGICYGGKCALRPDFLKKMAGQLTRPHTNATPKSMKNMTECELKTYIARRFSLNTAGRSKKTLLSQADKALENQLKSPSSIVAPPPRSLIGNGLNSMRVSSLRSHAKKKGMKGYSKFTKADDLRRYIRLTSTHPLFHPVVPPPKKVSPPKKVAAPKSNSLNTMKLANLRTHAKAKGIKGYSKYTKIANLRGFIRNNIKPATPRRVSPPKKVAAPKSNSLNTMKLANLRTHAKARGIKGYSKYTKIANLRGFIRTQL